MIIRVLFTTLIIFLSSHSLTAEISKKNTRIKITKTIVGGLTLSGDSCASIRAEAYELWKWKLKLDESNRKEVRAFPLLECKCRSGKCKIKIKEIVPELVNKTHMSKTKCSGPNCFNASLVGANVLSKLTHTSHEEMKFWINSPLCRKKKSNEKMKAGDIILIKDRVRGYDHSFTYISKNISYSKNGLEREQAYKLQRTSDIFKKYGVQRNCERIDQSTKSCNKWASAYSCQSLDSYLRKVKLNQEQRSSLALLSETDCAISNKVFNTKVLKNKNLRALYYSNLNIIRNLAESKLKKRFSSRDKLIWKAINHRALSLTTQVEMLENYHDKSFDDIQIEP